MSNRPMDAGQICRGALDEKPHRRERGTDDWAKLLFDRSFASVCIILLAPVLLLIALCIVWRDPGPVVFAHTRIGRGGRPFRCLKFRTMYVNSDRVLETHLARNPEARAEWEETRKLKDDPRVTPFGHLLRRTSLDELPQLINVSRGEMSLVGPRPIVEDELAYYDRAVGDYMAVRPGMTGLWQISGRSDVGYDTRVALDQKYVQTRSFVGDIKIIAQTLPVVLQQRGSC